MSILETEPVKGFINRILPVGILFHTDDGIEEYIDAGLEWSNADRAESIALNVKQYGRCEYRHENGAEGPWKGYDRTIPDGRRVLVDVSDDSLIINIYGAGKGSINEHARWDRKKKILDTFDQTDPDRLGCVFMYNQFSSQNERIHAGFTRFVSSQKFASMLGTTEEVKCYPLWDFKSAGIPGR